MRRWVWTVVAIGLGCGGDQTPTALDGGFVFNTDVGNPLDRGPLIEADTGSVFDSGSVVETDRGPAPVCEPGRSVGCVCSNGVSGSQTCEASGQRYGACVCAEPDAGPPLCSTSNPGGRCPAGQSCMGGVCVSPCSPTAPSGVCPSGQRCIGGACCASPCDARCCIGGTFCVGPIAGANQCVAHCRVSSDCGAGSWCAAVGDDDGFCVPPGATVGSARRCNIDSDCTGGQACTPTLGSDGTPRRPFICTDPACTPYRQCRGILGSCPNGYCNLCAASGRCYCAQVCTSDAMCGPTAGCIVFGVSRGSCSANQTACAPR